MEQERSIMKAFVQNYTFIFTFESQEYILTVDDESCDYGCTFSVIFRDSSNLSDLKRRLAERNLKYHLYKISEVDISEEQEHESV